MAPAPKSNRGRQPTRRCRHTPGARHRVSGRLSGARSGRHCRRDRAPCHAGRRTACPAELPAFQRPPPAPAGRSHRRRQRGHRGKPGRGPARRPASTQHRPPPGAGDARVSTGPARRPETPEAIRTNRTKRAQAGAIEFSSPATHRRRKRQRICSSAARHQPFSSCRAITIRWIWLVPSYIWVVVDRTAVSAARRRVGYRGISTDPARGDRLRAYPARDGWNRRAASGPDGVSCLPRTREHIRKDDHGVRYAVLLPSGRGRAPNADLYPLELSRFQGSERADRQFACHPRLH
jgi:hypothetical protein